MCLQWSSSGSLLVHNDYHLVLLYSLNALFREAANSATRLQEQFFADAIHREFIESRVKSEFSRFRPDFHSHEISNELKAASIGVRSETRSRLLQSFKAILFVEMGTVGSVNYINAYLIRSNIFAPKDWSNYIK